MRALCIAAVFAAAYLTPVGAMGQVAFDLIEDAAFVGWTAGPDGFIGTLDDVPDTRNVAGAASWGVAAVAPGPFTTFTTGVLSIAEPFVFEDGVSTINDFSVVGHTTAPVTGMFAFNDLPALSPHEIVTDVFLRVGIRTSNSVCFQPGPCTVSNALALVDLDVAGFLLLRGTNPNDLPGIGPDLAAYLNLLASVVAIDWTAIMIFEGGALGLTALVTTDPVELRRIPASTSSREAVPTL